MNARKLFYTICATGIALNLPSAGYAFSVDPSISASRRASWRLSVSNVNDPPKTRADAEDDDGLSDEQLLKMTPKAQLVSLCEQFSLPTKGKKAELLQRLRDHAAEQSEKQRQVRMERKKKVEEGSDDEREKFEIVGDDDFEEEDDDIFLCYQSLDASNSTEEKKNSKKTNPPKRRPSNYITVPPPPPVEPDENGERVVTVYSSDDQHDLTGVAASQPGQASTIDSMSSGLNDVANSPWEDSKPQAATSSDLDAAKEAVTDLVQTLLAMTGAPAFQEDADDLSALGIVRKSTSYESPEGFVGFDPSKVPADMLVSASKNLRAGRGSVLQDVLRQFELRAIGHDGASGDNMERGGGHYRQVSKVRSFLEGFRRAEVRRIARETATLLLDKLVSEGIEGLDVTLATMTRSSDDTSDEGGELNDSLLDYLNDVVRQQQKKVDQMVDSAKKIEEFENSISRDDAEDEIEKLWEVGTAEDGHRVETFDPNSPVNRKALQEAFAKDAIDTTHSTILPSSAPEKLLLLLELLRERVKTEAAFSHDEKARNLRVLAYCLKLKSDDHRKELFKKEFGTAIDRLDSFAELVSSSIEYGESTSHQLQPSKAGSLNVRLLKHILELTQEMKQDQSWRASGATSSKLRP